jgi:hypothetical protein
MKLKIENETHWQARDVKKLAVAALRHSGLKYDHTVKLKIGWVKPGNVHGEVGFDLGRRTLLVNLPKRGPKDDPLTMLAASSVSDEPVLAPSVVYAVARGIAICFLDVRHRMPPKYEDRLRELKQSGGRTRPGWLPKNAFIKRYAKPKPPPKKTFMQKVEEALERAEARVEEWEEAVEHAETHLRRAQKDLKAEQKRLRDARKRAEERGDPVERIGRSHRLYGRI